MTKNEFIQRAVLALIAKHGYADAINNIERRIREAQLHAGTLQNLGFSFSPEGATDEETECLKRQNTAADRCIIDLVEATDIYNNAFKLIQAVMDDHPRYKNNLALRKISNILRNANCEIAKLLQPNCQTYKNQQL